MMTKQRVPALCTNPEWLGRSDCRNCGIRHMMLFSGFDDSDFDHILEPIDNLRYAERTQLYAQGEQNNKVYSIRRGVIKLIQTQTDGSLRIVRLLGPGAIVGIEALLDKPYRHTAIALKELDVCRISIATLKQLELEKPWLNEKVMAHWEQHLSIADRWISELSSGSMRSRILKLFSFLIELNDDNSDTIHLFGYEDMASIIGTSRETFSRILGELKNEGLISKTADSHIYRLSITDGQ